MTIEEKKNQIINLIPSFDAYRNAFIVCLCLFIGAGLWVYSELDYRMKHLESVQAAQTIEINNNNIAINERILVDKVIEEKIKETKLLVEFDHDRVINIESVNKEIKESLTNNEKNININKDLMKELIKVIKNLNSKKE